MTANQTHNRLLTGYQYVNRFPYLRWINWTLGILVHLFTYLSFRLLHRGDTYQVQLKQTIEQLRTSPLKQELEEKYSNQYAKKLAYFNEDATATKKQRLINRQVDDALTLKAKTQLAHKENQPISYQDFYEKKLTEPLFLCLTFIPGLLLYSFYFLYHQPFLRFVFERLFSTVFVIIGVIVVVFTILYFSPTDAAANILGEAATMEQRIAFNEQYGLNEPYWVQLSEQLKGLLTFDLGYSFTGNAPILNDIQNRFPVTLTVAFSSLLLAVAIAVPVGMISAAKVNSFWDYSFMFIALIGLSIPSFWQGLIFILTFSIKGNLLPSSYDPGNWLSLIMPVIVLGTGLAASIARMTRSSLLEVMHEDYMMTAKAKGLNSRQIFLTHGLRNAWIPILTVIGLQFGVMLGGAAVTEKVFNIKGLGSYIVDKQFIPDIPAILAGVVYIAIAISLVNLLVDLLYAVLNPRIRSQLKND